MKRVQLTAAVLIITLFAALGWVLYSLHEPSYQGRPVHAWLQDLDDQQPNPFHARAEEAIKHLGSKAVPEIVNELNYRDDSWKGKLVDWAWRHHLVKTAPPAGTARQIHHHAVLGCYILGPKAKPAIPALISVLTDGYTQGYVGAALGRIGPEAIQPLIGCVSSTNFNVRREAVHALGSFRSNALVVMPVLIRSLDDPHPAVRSLAAMSIGQMVQEPELALRAIIPKLEDPDAGMKHMVCLTISKYDEQASAAKPRILTELNSPDPEMRACAAITLARIVPHDTATIEKVMPQLLENIGGLKSPHVRFPLNYRSSSIEAMGHCGKLAQTAIPTLLPYLNSDDFITRYFTTNALKAINSQAASDAGLK